MTGRRPGRLPLAALALVVGACNTTVDSLGWNDANGIVLRHLTPRASYPNAFRDVMGKSDAEISTKIAAAYMQLFHGDPNLMQPIYFPIGTDQASIRDILHNDVRTEGVGWAMLISVELGKRDEFDRLWTYAKAVPEVSSGAAAGYFNSWCDTTAGTTQCLDPFGLQQFVMALLLANDLWDGTPGGAVYSQDVRELLTLMRHKQDENGGVVDGVTDTFDARAKLPFDFPDITLASQSRPSIAMPAYYDLWTEATGDPFWSNAAAAARAYWQRATNPTTGMAPVRARFDGTPVPGGDTFDSESFRAELNMALDYAWSGGTAWETATCNQLMHFFLGQGIDKYGDSYSLDGTMVLDPTHDPALIAANGAAALVANTSDRVGFVEAVWNLDTPAGVPRYYAGLLDLLALMVMGGQMRVF
jgi:oligosaccharide reducing-end xylanase